MARSLPFPMANAHPGRVGSGQVGTITFRIPKGSSDYWKQQLAHHQVTVHESHLFGQPTLELQDPHELSLALVEGEAAETTRFLGSMERSYFPLSQRKHSRR